MTAIIESWESRLQRVQELVREAGPTTEILNLVTLMTLFCALISYSFV